jgi:TRAP-type C4-dicarboxylate transport system permease small subunit
VRRRRALCEKLRSSLPTTVIRNLHDKTKALVSIFTQLVVLIMLGVLIKESIAVSVFNMAQVSPALRIPMGLPYAALPVGFTLMFVYLLEKTLSEIVRAASSARAASSNPPTKSQKHKGVD